MKKAFIVSLLIVVVLGGLSFAVRSIRASRQNQVASTEDPAREEGRRFREVLRERGIDHPNEENVAALCKEGFAAACAETGRLQLVKCQQSEGPESASCDQARKTLDEVCASGSVHSCDVIFQADELISIRPAATANLEKFCSEQKPQACKTFEVALRNGLDLDRKAGLPNAEQRKILRAKYVKVSNENCDKGFYFSCLALVDEDRSSATPQALAAAEKRLRAICDKASDRFEKEDCLSFAEYLALSERRPEAEKFANGVCADESEAGCLTALRIQFSTLKDDSKKYSAVKDTCADSKKGALLVDYCKALQRAIDGGAVDWRKLSVQPALLESAHAVSFDDLLTIKPRELY